MVLVLSSFLLISFSSALWDNYEQDQSFHFYLGEFVENKLPENHPMLSFIEDSLAEEMFNTNNSQLFKERIRKIQAAYRSNPNYITRFDQLDRRLEDTFQEKLKRAKRIRWLSAAGGAIIGALIAIPVGKQINSKALWIAVPTAALAGGGLGYLLADLLAMPDYDYSDVPISSDLEMGLADLEETLRGGN